MLDNSKNISSKNEANVQDKDVMPYFTLLAEYAFVARALSQMDGVGKGLDPDFDFISASAPYIVEVKGAEAYLKERALKVFIDAEKNTLKWQTELFKKFGFDTKKYKKSKK